MGEIAGRNFKPELTGFQLWHCQSVLGDSDAQGVDTELGAQRWYTRRGPVIECGLILEGGMAKSHKLLRR